MISEKYLHIKYKHCGRGWEHGDCFNLLRLFYKEELGVELADFIGYAEYWYKEKNFLIDKCAEWGFLRVASPSRGDAILFKRGSKVSHCGVVLDHEYYLHTTKAGTAVHSLYALYGGLEVYGFYRHKELSDADKIS